MANETARKLRRTMTRQEVKLWLHLRELRRLGFHVRRQVPIKDFIVDFACYHPRVIVELDGSQHAKQRHVLQDRLRDAQLPPRVSGSSAYGTTMSTPILKVCSISYCTN